VSGERATVVIAGAGARGGYEAGILSVLVPALRAAGAAALTFVGTSAGAINAALFSAFAHLAPDEQAERVLDVWRGISVAEVFSSPLLGFPRLALRATGQFLQLPGLRLVGLLDTHPLRRTAEHAIDWEAFRSNLDGGRAALAVVATSGADNHTVVFVDRAESEPLPPPDDLRPIAYVAAHVRAEHVLASSAIPVAFPPVEVPGHGFFLDGGVRLNAPLKPALALGAETLAVVATHPVIDPGGQAPADGGGAPDVDDTIVRLIDAALVDRMVEDLRTLAKINALVESGGQTGHKVVPYLFAGPAERGTLGRLAAQIFERRRRLRGLRQAELRVLGRLLIGDGPRRGDLLSYLFFDHEFIEASIELGQRDAAALLGGDAGLPWQTGALTATVIA
jgi:NTE family protein